MSKHIGYVAALTSELPDLIHAPERVSLRVYPSIVSATGAAAQGAHVYEVTIELADDERFSGRREYSSRSFDTFMDAFDYAAVERGVVDIEAGDDSVSICSRLKLGPRVMVVGW